MSVIRRVAPCSTEATKTSPRATNATSLPSGESANSLTWEPASNGTTASSRRSAAAKTVSFRLSVAPAGRIQMLPSYA
ncbi:MAG: hypothetical protein BWX64_02772 [Acidobacteria bacterium ADurb.Bin051]|nr:MAG: hypothetical protein BWX64_02772 [Acidobacteria bacterium ADurb.Bin051]